MKLNKIQLGIFFEYDRPDRLSDLLTSSYSEQFDGPPLAFPTSIPDFPSHQLNSDSKMWEAKISQRRADLFYYPSPDTLGQNIVTNPDSNIDILDQMVTDLVIYLQNSRKTINRITNVCYYVHEDITDPVTYIQETFFKAEKISPLTTEISIRRNIPTVIGGVNYNYLNQYDVGSNVVDESSFLVVTKDFNTSVEKTSFNIEEFRTFIDQAKAHVRNTDGL